MDFISILNYFGITPAAVTPLVLVAVAAIFAVFKHTKPLTKSLQDVRERFVVVESRVGDLWKDRLAPARSPRQLNDAGNNILEKSGIKEIINEKREYLKNIVLEKKPANPYDAEKLIMRTVFELESNCPDVVDRLKEGAFKSGADTDGVLFVGAIYLRDLIFEEIGFKLSDI